VISARRVDRFSRGASVDDRAQVRSVDDDSRVPAGEFAYLTPEERASEVRLWHVGRRVVAVYRRAVTRDRDARPAGG
jgi:hypothetical protein